MSGFEQHEGTQGTTWINEYKWMYSIHVWIILHYFITLRPLKGWGLHVPYVRGEPRSRKRIRHKYRHVPVAHARANKPIHTNVFLSNPRLLMQKVAPLHCWNIGVIVQYECVTCLSNAWYQGGFISPCVITYQWWEYESCISMSTTVLHAVIHVSLSAHFIQISEAKLEG